ncbi:hypothetical protein BH23BAC1_BH23BAC1_25450 [soil metagenome]
MTVEIFASTDVGRNYDHNEDNFAICKDLSLGEWVFRSNEQFKLSEKGAILLIADGMGGTNSGEVASNIAQQSVREDFTLLENIPSTDKEILSWLKKTINHAHEEIVNFQGTNLETAGMGTTLTVVWIFNHKSYVAWCGDSRVYRYRQNTELHPLTDDHSVVWELVKSGDLTPEEARLHPESNIITQSLGTPSYPPKPDAKVFDLKKGDRLLMCSDGLNGMLGDLQIMQILNEEINTINACKKLIEEANLAGGKDNITVILLDVKESENEELPITGSVEKESENLNGKERNFFRSFKKKRLISFFLLGFVLIVIGIAASLSLKSNIDEKLYFARITLHYDPFSELKIISTHFTAEEIDSIIVTRKPENGTISYPTSVSLNYKPSDKRQVLADSMDVRIFKSNQKSMEARLLLLPAKEDLQETSKSTDITFPVTDDPEITDSTLKLNNELQEVNFYGNKNSEKEPLLPSDSVKPKQEGDLVLFPAISPVTKQDIKNNLSPDSLDIKLELGNINQNNTGEIESDSIGIVNSGSKD